MDDEQNGGLERGGPSEKRESPDEAENACENVTSAAEEEEGYSVAMEEDQPPKDHGQQVFGRVYENLAAITGHLGCIFETCQSKHGKHQQKVGAMKQEIDHLRNMNDQEEHNLDSANAQFHQSWKQIAQTFAPTVLSDEVMNE